jgi:hypothetical protein
MHHDGLPIDVERAGGALLADIQRPHVLERHLRFMQAHPRCHRCGARATAETNLAVGGRRAALCRSCAGLNAECRAYIRGTGPAPVAVERRALTSAERREKQREMARLYGAAPATATGPYAVQVNPGIVPSAAQRVLLRRLGYPC